jgi:hypothetical protein
MNGQFSPEGMPTDFRQTADAATIYQNSVHWMLESGVQPELLSQIIGQADTLFPDKTQRQAALSFTQELQGFVNKYGKDLDPKHVASMMQDAARQDFDIAAQIVRTLTPDHIWQEKVEPQLPPNSIKESPRKLPVVPNQSN